MTLFFFVALKTKKRFIKKRKTFKKRIGGTKPPKTSRVYYSRPVVSKDRVMYRNMSNDKEALPYEKYPPIKNDKSKLSKIEDGKSSIANK